MNIASIGVAVGHDALMPDWLERSPVAELRDEHRAALSVLTAARRRRLLALDRHQRQQGEVLAGDHKLGAANAAERREVDEETGRAMVALADFIDQVIDTVGEPAMRDRLQSARRNAAWLRKESRPLLEEGH